MVRTHVGLSTHQIIRDSVASPHALWYDRGAVHIFLLFAVPLSYIYVLILRDLARHPPAFLAIPALKGALVTLIVAIGVSLFTRFTEQPFSGPGLYFYLAIHDFVMPAAICFLLYLVMTPGLSSLSPDERLVSILSFLTGHFAVQGFLDLFERYFFTSYELFVAPAMRVALILMIAVLYYRFSDETFWVRYLYLFLLVLSPFAVAVPQFVLAINYAGWAAGATAFLFLGAFAMILFWTGKRPTFR
jgi:hypothetical protein